MPLLQTAIEKKNYKTVVYDLLAFGVITFIPGLSHLTAIPFYLLEPMRIILLLSIVYTSRKNVYLLTIALPVFSFIISAHPVFAKSLLITSEMALNVFLFYFLLKFFKNSFLPAAISIFLSKSFYYSVKFILISTGIIASDLVSTPFMLQLTVGLSVSLFLFYFYEKERTV